MIALFEPGIDHSRIYQGTDTRAAGLFWGVALAFCWKPARQLSSRAARGAADLAGIAGIAGIIALMVLSTGSDVWLYHWGFAALSLSTMGVLVAVSQPETKMSAILGCSPLRWLGERTYGIYLWHMPFLAFLPQQWVQEQPLLAGCAVSALSIAIAAVSWRFFEDPIRRHGFRALYTRAEKSPRSKAATSRSHFPILCNATCLGAVLVIALACMPTSSTDPGTDGASEMDRLAQAQAQQDASATSSTATSVAPIDPTITCETVIHVGDSTSLALDSELYIADPEQRLSAQYYRVGAQNVINDTKGARATFERLGDDPNIVEVLDALLAQQYPNPCWVLAVGTNDAANIEVGNQGPASYRIDTIMEMLEDQPSVMWGNLRTINPTDPSYPDSAMESYSAALEQACEQYPNLRIYDWRDEVQPDWFIEDGIHPNSTGAIEKFRRYADALAQAFPAQGGPAAQCVVTSGDGEAVPAAD